jgi:DNA-binding MarR family transcriptional regulator
MLSPTATWQDPLSDRSTVLTSAQHVLDIPAPFTPHLETTRRVFLLANQIGVAATKAIIESGLGGLSSNDAIGVLAHLAGEGPSRPRDLLEITHLTSGGLSNLFDRLESAGFITRSYGIEPSDRRSATVAITAAGIDAVTKIDDIVSATIESLEPALVELVEALDWITTQQGRHPSRTISRPSISRAGLLSMAGAAMTEALYEADPDTPAPDKAAIVLSCAAQPGHTRPRHLIEQTALSSGGVSQLLDRLENAGLIRRRTGETPDRRAVTVELTQHGRQHLERQLVRVAEHLTLLQRALDEPER